MGIAPLHAELLILEHKRKPLPKTVHLLGRQTVLLSIDDARKMMLAHGVEPFSVDVEVDQSTVGAHQSQRELINDRTFFGLMGVQKIIAIDHTDYEGAELIIDLNNPISDEHAGSMDFIFGGSVVDNIFDPATYLRNTARLLRPGGRLFDQTILSQHHHPYALITPAWALDYFVVNKFINCLMYVTEYSASNFVHMYGVVPTANDMVSDFGPARGNLPIGLVLLSEKGRNSTWEATPIQDQYRSPEQEAAFQEALASIQSFDYPEFEVPTELELMRMSLRASRSFRYLGVIRNGGAHEEVTGGIRIVEASYGLNCSQTSMSRSAITSAYRGNITDVLASMANGAVKWEWVVDTSVIGDPAPGLGKDLEVFYVDENATTPVLRRLHIPAEAAGQTLSITL